MKDYYLQLVYAVSGALQYVVKIITLFYRKGLTKFHFFADAFA